jgi:hypothetical protein
MSWLGRSIPCRNYNRGGYIQYSFPSDTASFWHALLSIGYNATLSYDARRVRVGEQDVRYSFDHSEKPDQGVGPSYTLSSGGVVVVALTDGGIMAFKRAGNRSFQTMWYQ